MILDLIKLSLLLITIIMLSVVFLAITLPILGNIFEKIVDFVEDKIK